MIEVQVDVPTNDGAMPTFIVHPDRAGTFPPIIMLMDGAGISEVLRDLGRTLASVGYFVMLPNLFHRTPGISTTGPDGAFDMENIRILNASIDQARVSADVTACLDHAEVFPAARSGPAGLIGYCMGGRYALLVSNALGDRISATAAIHPGRLATDSPESPHRNTSGIKAELYLGVAETDPYLAPDAVTEMRAALDAQPIRYRLDVLPGSRHGFAFQGRENYHKPSAFTAWERAFDLFGRTLDPATP